MECKTCNGTGIVPPRRSLKGKLTTICKDCCGTGKELPPQPIKNDDNDSGNYFDNFVDGAGY